MSERSVRVVLTAVTGQYQAAMAKAGANTRALEANIASTTRAQQTGTSAMGRFGLTTGSVMGGLVVGALASSAKAAMDFESSFAGVRKVVDGSEEELKGLADGMLDLSTKIPVSVNELNNIAESAGQLGIAKENILGFTETIAKLGMTTNLVGEQGATLLAKFANITQMPQENFDRLGSTLVALGNDGASTESDIANFAVRIAGAGEIAGLTEASILGISNAMTSVTNDVESGSTAVQKVLLAMNDSVTTSDDRLQVFADTAGMTSAQFQSAWQKDPATAFAQFVTGLGAAGDNATAILRDLNFSDQRLIKSFLSLAGAGDLVTDSLELGTTAFRENTDLTEESAKRLETAASRVQLAQNQIQKAQITIGSNLLPIIGDAADAVASAFPGGNEWLDQALQAAVGNTKDLSKEFLETLSPWERGLLRLKEMQDPLANIPSALSAAGAAIGGFSGDQERAADSTQSATDAVTQQILALKELEGQIAGAGSFLAIEGAAIGVKNAMLDLKDSQDAVNELVKDGKEGTREYRRALLARREAELGVVTSQKELEEALFDYTQKVESGEISQRDAIAAVRAFGDAAGLTKGQVENLIDRIKSYDSALDGIPSRRKTDIETEGLTEAQAAVQLWKNMLESIPRRIPTLLYTTGSGPLGNKVLVPHAGGVVGSAGASRMHSGFGPLRGDEVPAILQRGEIVLSRAQVAAGAGAGGVVYNISVDARGSTMTPDQVKKAVREGIEEDHQHQARFGRWQVQVAT